MKSAVAIIQTESVVLNIIFCVCNISKEEHVQSKVLLKDPSVHQIYVSALFGKSELHTSLHKNYNEMLLFFYNVVYKYILALYFFRISLNIYKFVSCHSFRSARLAVVDNVVFCTLIYETLHPVDRQPVVFN
jgi:hypothetical protein